MTDRAYGARREIQILGDPRRFALRIVGEQQDEPFALGKAAQARRDTRHIERGERRGGSLHRRIDKTRRQRLAPSSDPSFRVAHHPAGSEDERSNLIDLLYFTGAQALDREQQHLLREIVSARIAPQVPTAVQPHPRREAAVELRLFGIGGAGRAAGDSARERLVAGSLDR